MARGTMGGARNRKEFTPTPIVDLLPAKDGTLRARKLSAYAGVIARQKSADAKCNGLDRAMDFFC